MADPLPFSGPDVNYWSIEINQTKIQLSGGHRVYARPDIGRAFRLLRYIFVPTHRFRSEFPDCDYW